MENQMEKMMQAFIDQLGKADTYESTYKIIRQFHAANGQDDVRQRLVALANIDKDKNDE